MFDDAFFFFCYDVIFWKNLFRKLDNVSFKPICEFFQQNFLNV